MSKEQHILSGQGGDRAAGSSYGAFQRSLSFPPKVAEKVSTMRRCIWSAAVFRWVVRVKVTSILLADQCIYTLCFLEFDVSSSLVDCFLFGQENETPESFHQFPASHCTYAGPHRRNLASSQPSNIPSSGIPETILFAAHALSAVEAVSSPPLPSWMCHCDAALAHRL